MDPSLQRARYRTLVALGVALACSDGGTEPATPANLVIAGGNGQSAIAGSAVPTPPSVRVTTAGGAGVGGVRVTFTVTAGGGSVTGANATTNASGVATAGSWTLGTVVGANALRASAAGLTAVTFSAEGTVGPPTLLAAAAGEGQTATVGMPVAVPPSLSVQDANGNGVSGVAVTFAVTAGAGSVTGADQTTDAQGTATVGGWTLGIEAGPQQLTATVAGGPQFVFTATATADAAASITIADGDAQTAIAGTPVPTAPTVLVRDQFDNGVSDATVVFEITAGAGAIEGGTVLTDEDGLASVGSWTLGVGANALSATAGALPAVVFTADGIIGPPTTLTPVAGDGLTATVNTAVSEAPAVRVTDLGGNELANVSIDFTPGAGSGSVTGSPALSNGQGIATVGSWTLGTKSGANTLTASVDGVATTFTATGAADAPFAMVVAGGDGQTATAGTPVPVPPSVLIIDQFDNGVPNETVTFAPQPTSGTVTGSPATTDADGVATVERWVLGGAPGVNTLDATHATLPAVAFTGTGTPGPAQVIKTAGDDQAATVGTDVAVPPQVQVLDGLSNPVAGEPVTFNVASGGGSVVNGSTTTDANGVATVGGWTLGTVAGPNTVEVAVGTLPPTVFTASGTPDVAATLAIVDGDQQQSLVDTPVLIAPTVVVTDQFGNGVPSESVMFTVVQGNGAVSGSPVTTDDEGLAAVDTWTLGADRGTNLLEAAVTGLATVTFTAQAVLSRFRVTLDFVTQPSAEALPAFTEAVDRWSRFIIGDLLGPISFQNDPIPAGLCGVDHAEFSGVVDDVLIFVDILPLTGRTLAQAFPCFFRIADTTAVASFVVVNANEIDGMVQDGSLADVVTHEIAHALGFGSLWRCEQVSLSCGPEDRDFLVAPSDTAFGGTLGADTHFNGPQALAAFDQVGGADYLGAKVPVENDQSEFTTGGLDGHWREGVFDTELLTPRLDAGANPFSRVTVASMADIRYVVNITSADAYALPLAVPDAPAVRGRAIDLSNDIRPHALYAVDQAGRWTRVR